MDITFGNLALPVHQPFHRSGARERCNFGAMGSGKSYAICDEAIAMCLEQPGISGLITRKTIPELRDSTERVFAERVPPELWNAGKLTRAGGHFERFLFPNGSEVLFRSIDDWKKLKSLNLGFIAWDELSEFDEDSYRGMLFRLRQSDITVEARALGYTHKITRQASFASTNPEGKDWVYYYFHPNSPTRKEGSAAFFSTTLDNPFLPASYVEDVMNMPRQWVLRYVLCQFDDFAGRIYEDWTYATHVVPMPKFEHGFRPVCWMGMDPGTESPTAGLWVWNDRENRRLVGIAEYQQMGLAAEVHARNWRQIESNKRMAVKWRVADPNAITQRSRETMVGLDAAYGKLGYNFAMGASSHKVRIPQLGRLITTRRFVLAEGACPLTYEAIRNYQYKDLSPTARALGEDPAGEPLKKNTHLVECAQYLAGREVPQLKFDPRRAPETMDQQIHAAIRKQLQVKARGRRRQRHGLKGVTV